MHDIDFKDIAENIFRTLNSKGIKTMIVTNECRYGEKVLRDDLTEMGVKLPDNTKIITSGMSVYKYLKKKVERFSADFNNESSAPIN